MTLTRRRLLTAGNFFRYKIIFRKKIRLSYLKHFFGKMFSVGRSLATSNFERHEVRKHYISLMYIIRHALLLGILGLKCTILQQKASNIYVVSAKNHKRKNCLILLLRKLTKRLLSLSQSKMSKSEPRLLS